MQKFDVNDKFKILNMEHHKRFIGLYNIQIRRERKEQKEERNLHQPGPSVVFLVFRKKSIHV